jgi:hypothetical protein
MTEEDIDGRPQVKYILKAARTGHAAVAQNVKEGPIAFYIHKGWIDETQRDSGEIFLDLWEAAQIGVRAIN